MPDEQIHLPGEPPDPDLLDRATAALRNLPVPDGPPPDVLRRALDLMASGSPTVTELRPTTTKRRLFTMRFIAKLAVAAVIAVALVGVFFRGFNPFGASVAFADVLQRIQEVHSVKFKADSVVELPNVPAIKTTAEILLAEPMRMRQTIEPGGMTNVFDFAKGRGVTLEPKSKTAMVMEISNIPPSAMPANLLDSLRKLDEKTVKLLGEKEIDGKKARGFRSETPTQDMTLWADVETQLPIRMEVDLHMPGLPKTTSVMHDFEWGPPVDDAMFSLTPPEGYRVQTMNLNAAPATEKDLIEGLKQAAELNGGKFPDEFSLAMIGEAAKRLDAAKADGDGKGKGIGQAAIAISRALTFCADANNGKDFRYAGAGVESGKADAPVFWYQPKDSPDYRVIYGDFSVKTVKAAELPDVPSKAMAAKTPTK